TLADEVKTVDPEAIHAARETARAEIATALREPFAAAYRRLADPGPYKTDGRSIGRRALRNACLSYLTAGDPSSGVRLAKAQFDRILDTSGLRPNTSEMVSKSLGNAAS